MNDFNNYFFAEAHRVSREYIEDGVFELIRCTTQETYVSWMERVDKSYFLFSIHLLLSREIKKDKGEACNQYR